MKFLKLSSVVINTAKISSIQIHNDKYYINVINHTFGGSFIGIFGTISSTKDHFQICKKKDIEDYQTVTNWINNIKN